MLNRFRIFNTILSVRSKIQWKPDSAIRHLEKRKKRGHLPISATIEDYEQIILAVLEKKEAEVYLYHYNNKSYITVTAFIRNQYWLVMFTDNGILESAFVVERPQNYLNKPCFERIGFLDEVEHES